MDQTTNYFQLIYRVILSLIGVWFLSIIWPYISDVVLMLVFAFLFTTVLLSSVDSLERKIGNRGLSVLAVVLMILIVFGTFIGSFISQMSYQAKDFSNRIDKETLTAEFSKLGDQLTAALPNFMKDMQSTNGDMAGKLSEIVNTTIGSLASMAGAVSYTHLTLPTILLV